MLRLMLSLGALTAISVHAFAANECDGNSRLTAAQIQQLLRPGSEIYACGHGNGESWNETLKTAADVWDFKLGFTSKTDPPRKVGTYSIGNDGTISYNYGSAQFSYRIAPVSPTTFPGTGQYYFCQQGNGPAYIVTVSQGPGNC